MVNELRDPHDPVIPGEHEHPAEGHGGVTMPIGVSGGMEDPHEEVIPGAAAKDNVPHMEDQPAQNAAPLDEQLAETLPSGADLDAVAKEKEIADGDTKAEGA